MAEPNVLALYTDVLTPLAQAVLGLNAAAAYTAPTAPDTGHVAAHTMLAAVHPEQLVVPPIVDRGYGQALLAGLWLWHDWLAESHAIAQKLPSPTGSFWHAIMHRREGDFDNSKYWYARCADHPVHTSLSAYASSMINPLPADKMLFRLIRDGWDPGAFVDLVRQVHEHPEDPRRPAVTALQQTEWRVLFEHSLRAATGK